MVFFCAPYFSTTLQFQKNLPSPGACGGCGISSASMPDMAAHWCQFNFYAPASKGIAWHRDGDETEACAPSI